MEKKCSKYEGLFVFSGKEEFEKHLSECEDCKLEHAKMQKVSDLIKEIKPYYLRKRNKLRKMRAVAAVLFIMFFSATFGIIYNSEDLSESLMYGDTLTAEDLGFPVDSYGLLMVE